MADVQNSINPIPPPPLQGDNLPLLYYGLLVVGTAAAVLAMYNLIIIRWCTGRSLAESEQPPSLSSNSVADDDMSGANWGSSFKYKKGSGTSRVEKEGKDGKLQGNECCVCLSGFEDGDDVSELARCKHSFHAQCIGMWLYSHSDCPLCRQRVEIGASYPNVSGSASSGA